MSRNIGPKDIRWMEECVRLARKGEGHASPNPLVGAILVRGNRAVAYGYHRFLGGPHAEVECLKNFRGSAANTTLYVNLEPCSHHGKTPPCVDRIIQIGIPRVIIGMKDPNRLVAGKGIEALRKQGINVVVGVHEEACRELNRAFIRHITTGLPYVHLKLAQTLDGKIARRKGPARPITSEESRRLVHSWRSTHDAVMVGANTVIKDDPRLDVRLVRGRNPHVIILDGMLRVPPYSMALKGLKARKVYLCTSIRSAKAKSAKVRLLERKGVIVLAFPERRGQIDIRSACHVLYKEGIGILLVEGGSRVAGELLAVGLVDQLSLFVAPWALGVGVPTFSFPGTRMRPRQIVKPASVRHVGNDILLQYFFA